MKNIILERRVSIFDISTPYLFTDTRYEKYLSELKNVDHIEDATVSGEFIYGTANARKAKNIRIEVDSRFITDADVLSKMNEIFIKVK